MIRGKYIAVIGLVGVSMFIVGCGDDDDEDSTRPSSSDNGHRLYYEEFTQNGIEYNCIVYDDDRFEQGGVWCEREPVNGSG